MIYQLFTKAGLDLGILLGYFLLKACDKYCGDRCSIVHQEAVF